MLRFFVSVTLPSLLVVLAVAGVAGAWLGIRARHYRAECGAIRAQRRAIRQAQDALAAVITDSLASQGTRDQALPAYEALGRLLKEKGEN